MWSDTGKKAKNTKRDARNLASPDFIGEERYVYRVAIPPILALQRRAMCPTKQA